MRKNIIRPFVSKTLSLIMLLSMITAVSAAIAMVPVRKTEAATNSSTDNYTAITFEQKEKEFLSSPSLQSSAVKNNCYEYMMAYVRCMAGNNAKLSEFPSYSNASEVLPGDVIQMQGHWFVVLNVSADTAGKIYLKTGESNWPHGTTAVRENTYKIYDNKLWRDGSSARPFIQGYHIIRSFFRAARTCVDSTFYPAMYPDIKAAFGSDYDRLFSHYMTHGLVEGRVASLTYDVNCYISSSEDLKKVFNNNYRQAFYHYVTYWFEDRITSRLFRPGFYLGKYSDLARSFGSGNYIAAAEHFNRYFSTEARQGIASFSVMAYSKNYIDLQKAFRNNWIQYVVHYYEFGYKEGRKTT